jgi:hypothetical protein
MEPVLFYSTIVGSIIISVIVCLSVRKKSGNDKSNNDMTENNDMNDDTGNKPNDKEDDTKYYILQRSLTIYEKQLESINRYKKQLESQLESIRQSNEELERIQSAIVKEKWINEHSDRIVIAKQNLSLLEKCATSISRTNDVDVLYTRYIAALEYIRWFENEELLYPNNPYLIDSPKFLNELKIKLNEMICRIAEYHFAKYKYKFYSLYTLNAMNTHTQKIFITLDTLLEMTNMDVENGQIALEKIKEYQEHVKMISNIDLNNNNNEF